MKQKTKINKDKEFLSSCSLVFVRRWGHVFVFVAAGQPLLVASHGRRDGATLGATEAARGQGQGFAYFNEEIFVLNVLYFK